ncbi:MAG TPA: DUF6325 family protein [Thermomicrobiales bacterium]|nr:DUF6325 family protein [Thermomicrobiales bacterium]
MTYGPMQLIVIGFGQSALPLDVVNQLRRLRDDGVVRLVDAVYVSKDEHGDLTEIQASDLSDDEVVLLGMLSGALFGYGASGESGMELGAELGGMAAAESGEFGLDSDDIDEIADLIPRGTGAAFLLIEHLWAIGLKESIRNSNGFVIAHGWVTPETLVEMGAEAMAGASDGAD